MGKSISDYSSQNLRKRVDSDKMVRREGIKFFANPSEAKRGPRKDVFQFGGASVECVTRPPPVTDRRGAIVSATEVDPHGKSQDAQGSFPVYKVPGTSQLSPVDVRVTNRTYRFHDVVDQYRSLPVRVHKPNLHFREV